MSYPPRHPMGMPPVPPPGMMPPAYGFGYGMMPMGMMPMMRPPPMAAQVTTSQSKPAPPPDPPKKKEKEVDGKPPVTTVFVGNISDRAPDAMVRQMLQRCGNVLSWKRVQGASGKLQAFGFCEYEDPEATLQCMRLLNEWVIADKKLVVKVDAKTKTQLDDYRKKKKKREREATGEGAEADGEKEEGEEGDTDDEELDDTLDEEQQREDRVAKAGLDAIMREYDADLSKPVEESQEEKQKSKKKKEEKVVDKDATLDDMEIEEDKKDLINREINKFRDAHKI